PRPALPAKGRSPVASLRGTTQIPRRCEVCAALQRRNGARRPALPGGRKRPPFPRAARERTSAPPPLGGPCSRWSPSLRQAHSAYFLRHRVLLVSLCL